MEKKQKNRRREKVGKEARSGMKVTGEKIREMDGYI